MPNVSTFFVLMVARLLGNPFHAQKIHRLGAASLIHSHCFRWDWCLSFVGSSMMLQLQNGTTDADWEGTTLPPFGADR
uniref:Putative secreted protein n=1 Tax=Anopheles marajoara TaxID=58244 RepID=A0A2M4CC69_9DIPT